MCLCGGAPPCRQGGQGGQTAQRCLQGWAQCRGRVQGSRQGGHGPKWHLCGRSWVQPSRLSLAHSRRQRGGLAVFSRPQGPLRTVTPQAHAIGLVSGQG